MVQGPPAAPAREGSGTLTDRAIPPQQGDEGALFERYGARLRRATQLNVNTSPDIVDDACSFAWMKFLANQPRRETAFGWLKTVARNEALRLDGLARDLAPLPGEDAAAPHPISHRGRPETMQGMIEVTERLAELPQRERELVFLTAAGWRYQELADQEGISHTRVNQLLARASTRMREMDILGHDPKSPRAKRLRELERDPPKYLQASLGSPPRPNGRNANATEDLRREWRRLALAIDDFRSVNGVADPVRALGKDPAPHGRSELAERVAAFRRDRGLSRGLER